MSDTVLIAFGKDGKLYDDEYGTIQNSWRGGPVIWGYLEKKYLPPFIPEWGREKGLTYEQFVREAGYEPTRMTYMSGEGISEIVDLAYTDKLTPNEKIALITTFDRVLVTKEDIPHVIKAFRAFPEKSSLPEQADILEQALTDENVEYIGWIQTTVVSDIWSGGWDEEKDDEIPYDLNVNTEHYMLCDLLAESNVTLDDIDITNAPETIQAASVS